jgi:ASPM-SPD-2-Hydin domain-containing protein
MIKALGRRGARMLLTATALLAGAAGVALATIPGSTGVINGCYEKRTGILRVIDTEAGKTCLRIETPISWNQTGPKGDPGAQGPRGAQGPQGEQGEPGPASLSAFAGTPCTRAGGSAGTVRTSVGPDDVVTIRCESSGSGGGTPTEALLVEPPALNFGQVAVSTVSTRRVTVTNPNDVPVALSVLTSTVVYPFVSTCGTALGANASCSIDVSFAPINESTVVGELTISADPLPMVQVNLFGTGVP